MDRDSQFPHPPQKWSRYNGNYGPDTRDSATYTRSFVAGFERLVVKFKVAHSKLAIAHSPYQSAIGGHRDFAPEVSNELESYPIPKFLPKPKPLTEFHLFPKVPTEVRDAIWKLSLRGRIVELQLCGEPEDEDRYFYSVSEPVPVMLVCKDSRRSVLPFYPLHFNGRIRANISMDTIYLDYSFDESFLDFFSKLSKEETNQLTHLAINDLAGIILGNGECEEFWEEVRGHVKALPNLKTCKLVVDMQFASDALYNRDFESDQSKAIAFFDEIPEELLERDELKFYDLWRKARDCPHSFVYDHQWEACEGKDPMIECVYGWRREQPLECVKVGEGEAANYGKYCRYSCPWPTDA